MRGDRSTVRGCAAITIVVLLLAGGPAGTALADHRDEPRDDVWHVTHHVNASVVDNYATVDVGVEIVNEGPDPEFPFRVELPDGAYVTGLTITRDGTTYEAQIEEADRARERYEEAKSEHRSAGLVEQHASDDVYAYNINVEGTETVQATLTYERYLTANAGVYEMRLTAPATHRGIDEGATIEAHVQHGAGLDAVRATGEADVTRGEETAHVTRSVGPRGHGQATDLRVAYELAETEPGGSVQAAVEDGTGYFAHRFRADDATERVPLDIALVLDTSGSMKGDKIAQLEQATRRLVDELDDRDRLALTFFDDDTDQPWHGFRHVDANLTDEAFAALDRMRATGSTNIEQAIDDGFAPLNEADRSPERLPVVVFLTDGRPTDGIRDQDRLRTHALETNDAEAHVFSLAFGSDADWGLVHGLAQDGHGLARQIEAGQDAEVEISSFLTALTSPVLTDIQLAYPGDVETWRVGAPVLFAGGELLYVGTFDANRTELTADVSARDMHGTRSWNVSTPVETTNASSLPDLVAYQRIRALEDRIAAEGGNATLEERALQLALEHGFVTEQTSLVVDLPEANDGGQADGETDRQVQEEAANDARRSPTDTSGESRVIDGAEPADGTDEERTRPEETAEQPAQTPGPGAVASLLASIAAALAALRRS